MNKPTAFFLACCLPLGLFGCVTAHAAFAAETPVWKQPRTLAAAAPYCLGNKGVSTLRKNGDGGYWLICNDGAMLRVKIAVTPFAPIAVARL